ncbi:YceI family protein [Desulfococcus sp.]|uniref:YceI family protein n=1 Tax=Desulfococcus sp. TaxID=2025834 RepID=UPI0035931925
MNATLRLLSRLLTGTLMLAAFTTAVPVPAAADTYQVDPVHTYVLFRVKHLDIGYSYGRFGGPEGVIEWNEAAPEKSRVEMSVKAGNVDTDNDKRDQHLRSADFFNVDQHPVIAFKSTSVKKTGERTFDVSGDLTLLGKTRPVTVSVRQTGAGQDPWGKYRTGFETTFTVKRSEWGMNFMLNGVSDEVVVTVSAEGIRQ